METFDVKRPDADSVVLATAGDWHIGNRHCDEDGIVDYVGKIKEAGALVLLMGDLTENVIVGSKGEIMRQALPPREQIERVCELLEPVKDYIIGGLGGNHGARTTRIVDLDPDQLICYNLGCKYLGHLAMGRIQVGGQTHWTITAHHGVGGGAMLGSKLNLIAEKMTKVVPISDLYLAGHTHVDVAGSDSRPTFSIGSGNLMIDTVHRHFSGTGSMLGYEGYPEEKLLPPSVKCQVFHHLGKRRHRRKAKGSDSWYKPYRRELHYYY